MAVDGSGEPVVLPDPRKIFVDAEVGADEEVSAEEEVDADEEVGAEEFGPLTGVAFSPDNQLVVTASMDGTARVWKADGSDRDHPVVLSGHTNYVTSAAFSPDSKHVVTTSRDKTARVWAADGSDRERPVVLRAHTMSFDGHEAPVVDAAFSPDGKRVVTASWDKTARVWVVDGFDSKPRVLRGHETEVTTAAFSPDGKRILTASFDGTVRVWAADSGEPVVLDAGGSSSAAFSPDGRAFVTASDNGMAKVWAADGSGKPVVLPLENVSGATFSPDGRRVVTTSEADKVARVWAADAAGAPMELRGHEEEVESAAWSPDGTRLVTASRDSTIRVWPADGSGAPMILRDHHGSNGAVFSPTAGMSSIPPGGCGRWGRASAGPRPRGHSALSRAGFSGELLRRDPGRGQGDLRPLQALCRTVAPPVRSTLHPRRAGRSMEGMAAVYEPMRN